MQSRLQDRQSGVGIEPFIFDLGTEEGVTFHRVLTFANVQKIREIAQVHTREISLYQ